MHIATSDLCSTSDITYTQLFSAGGKDPEEWSKKYCIPESMNKQLSEISSDKECFDKAKSTYQDALNRSGYMQLQSVLQRNNP